jgi:hypothetical protein
MRYRTQPSNAPVIGGLQTLRVLCPGQQQCSSGSAMSSGHDSFWVPPGARPLQPWYTGRSPLAPAEAQGARDWAPLRRGRSTETAPNSTPKSSALWCATCATVRTETSSPSSADRAAPHAPRSYARQKPRDLADQYFGQSSGGELRNSAVVTQRLVNETGFIATAPIR